MRISLREKTLSYIVLTAFAAIALVPLLGVILQAVTPSGSGSGFVIPDTVALQNFVEAWERGHFSRYMLSSILVTVAVVVQALLVASAKADRTLEKPFSREDLLTAVREILSSPA